MLIPIIIAVAVLLLGGTAGILALNGTFKGQKPTDAPTESEVGTSEEPSTEAPVEENAYTGMLYWNIDRDIYNGKAATGGSSRPVSRDDGYYHILFAAEGRQVTRRCADKRLVDRIDMNDLMGLEFDENGVIVKVVGLNDIISGYDVQGLYLEEVKEDGSFVLNSAKGLNGRHIAYELPKGVRIFNMCGDEQNFVGQEMTKDKLLPGDRLYVFINKDDTITRCVVTERQIHVDIYWNVKRMWNSELLATSREPNADGEYEILFAVNGQQVTLKTKERSVATQIDQVSNYAVGLEFNSEGYISKAKKAASAIGGSTQAGWAHVIDKTATTVKAEKFINASDKGKIWELQLKEGYKIYDVSGKGEFVGVERDHFDLNNQIFCVCDASGAVEIMYIINRVTDDPVYWNVERMYDSQKQVSTRKKSSDGYYHILMAADGKQVDLKTEDFSIVTKIDAIASKNTGLKLDGNVILGLTSASSTRKTGGSTAASWADVTKIMDEKHFHTLKDPNSGVAKAGEQLDLEMIDDVEIYNCSSNYNSFVGEKTTLKMGDRVHCLTNVQGQVAVIFVVSRPLTTPIYWNVQRQYDSTNKVSKRVPAEDGYYHLLMATGGKQVELKTKDKAIVDKIDSIASYCCSLKTSGDIITKAYYATDTYMAKGGTCASWADITEIKDARHFHTLKDPNSGVAKAGEELDLTMASNCQVYNVSSGGCDNFVGEPSTIRVGDRLHCFKNTNGQVSLIFIVDRKFQEVEKLCPECGEVVTWKPYNGSFEYDTEHATHFYFAKSRTPNGQMGTTAEGIIHLDLNGKDLNCAVNCRAFQVTNNSYVTIMDLSDEKTSKVVANGGLNKDDESTQYGTMFYLPYTYSSLKLLNITVDGTAASYAKGQGMFYLATDATLVLENCDITAGTTESGSAIYSKGKVTLKDTKIHGGLVTTGSSVELTESGSLTVVGNSSVTGGKNADGNNANIFLPEGVKIKTEAGGITGGTLGITVAGSGVFTEAGFETYLTNFTSDLSAGTITADDTALRVDYTITGITFEEPTMTVKKGDITKLVVKTLPVNVSGVSFKFEVADPTAIQLTENGEIIGQTVSETPVTVTAKTEDEAYSATLLVTVEAPDETAHVHAENTLAKIHTGTEIAYQPWPNSSSLPATSGYYYLTEDVHLTAKQPIMPANQDLHICLNGFTIDNVYDGNAQTISMFNQGVVLSICDCSEGATGKVTANGTYNVPGRTIWARYGTLNIYGGTYIGAETNNSQSGGAICISAGATLNMYGGTIQGGKAVLNGTSGGNGGALSVLGTANIYDVTIKDGTSAQGGNIYVSGTLNMERCVVENGSATDGRGGNIFCDSNAAVSIKSTTIKGGTSTEVGGSLYTKAKTFTVEDSIIDGGETKGSGKAGGNIHIAGGSNSFKNVTFKNGVATNPSGSAIHMNTASGTLVLDNCDVTGTVLIQGAKTVTLKGATTIGSEEGGISLANTTATYLQAVTADSLTSAAKIYIGAAKAGVIVLGGKAYKDAFVSTISGLELQENGDDLELAVPPAPKHEHCVCGGSIENGTELGGGLTHTCVTKEWQPWESTDELPTYDDMAVGENYFFLTSDVQITANWKPGKNGSAVETDMGGRILILCLNGHKITSKNIGIILSISGQANFDITLTDCAETPGLIQMSETDKSNGTNPLFWINSKGTLNIYRITIDGNGLKANKNGALINVGGSSTLNLFSGTLKGANSNPTSNSAQSGGLVGIPSGSKFNMYGGTLSGGTSTAMGGNLCAVGATNIYAGTFENGTAFQGGNIYATGNFTINGNVTVKNGTATERGGNMWTDTSGVINVTGATFEGANSGKVGGSVYGKSKTMNFTNVTVKNSYSGDAGGAFSFANSSAESTVTLKNVKVEGCTSNNARGHAMQIYASTVNLVMEDCDMDNSVFLQSLKSVTLKGLCRFGGNGKAGLVLGVSSVKFDTIKAGSEIWFSTTAAGNKLLDNGASYQSYFKAFDGGTFQTIDGQLYYSK